MYMPEGLAEELRRNTTLDAMSKRHMNVDLMAANTIDKLEAENEQLKAEIEQLKRERDAAISDLKSICDDTGDGCDLCKHLPCVKDGVGYCIGWQWRGVKEGAEDG